MTVMIFTSLNKETYSLFQAAFERPIEILEEILLHVRNTLGGSDIPSRGAIAIRKLLSSIR